MESTLYATDLFAGAGGTSTGLIMAAREASKDVNLVAINHDRKALATHEANHPWAKHILTEVQSVKPSEAVPEGRLDILVASPECIYHSRALGGKPKNDQSRSSAWYLERWIKDLEVDSLLVENVPEFMNWGPLDENEMPIKEKKGTTFKFWLYTIRRHGYNIGYRVLNSADYGDATSRKRLFVVARKGDSPIAWPVPTHSREATNGTVKWRAAREIIDWSLRGESIFDRKRPLSLNTALRIIAGMKKFSGPELKPFIVLLEHSLLNPMQRVRDVDLPLPVVTGARGGGIAIARPFLLPVEGYYRKNQPKEVDDPMGTITQRGYGHLVVPFILSQASGGSPRDVGNPMPTIPTGGAHALIESFIYQANKGSRGFGLDEPVPTITTNNKLGKIDAFVSSYHGGDLDRNTSVEEPVPTVDTSNRFALVRSYLVPYYGHAEAVDIERPVPTVTTKDRFALVRPEIIIDGTVYRLEVYYRMLTPRELASAMGFPSDYVFIGNRTQTVKQIGNAVAVNTAKALISSLISRDSRTPTLMEVASS